MARMRPQGLPDFIRAVPKAELHLHIEGTLEPELMFRLAKRNKRKLRFKSAAEVRKAYAFAGLQSFLDIYYEGAAVLIEEEDFYDLAAAYFKRAAADNVRHAEIFFDPQAHTSRGVPFATVIGGIRRALVDAEATLGMTSRLILSFLRHLDEADAAATLDTALPFRDWITGVGLDSSELGHPPEKFRTVFARARALGLRCVAHAGEEGPPAYIWGALDALRVERIDHGNRCLEDAALVDRLVARRMPLTLCPLSNLKLKVVPDMAAHPLPGMLARGLLVTINSDDPAYFGGYINENFKAVAAGERLSANDVRQLAKNSFTASFLSAADQARWIAAIDRVAA
ncbi:MAG: adenosine deaminase [Proteobacteria bacterium]|nr:adenosine deaminase [Pseudomonadota bacterium]